MKTVVVRPERCIGCMQCMTACAQAHSKSGTLFGALSETPLPAPRISVAPGPGAFAFPNKCRHCDPAPCMAACMPAALGRDAQSGAVLVDASRCINCGMCAMACPFGVVRYRADAAAPGRRTVAVKCDNCTARQREGRRPACVEACFPRALEFGEENELQRREGRRVARQFAFGAEGADAGHPESIRLWRALGSSVR